MSELNYLPELNLPEPLRPYAELWLLDATAFLSNDAKDRISAEVATHCRERFEALLLNGVDAETAAQRTIQELGRSSQANRRYRGMYVTCSDERRLKAFREWNSIGEVIAGYLASVLVFAAAYVGLTFDGIVIPALLAVVAVGSIQYCVRGSLGYVFRDNSRTLALAMTVAYLAEVVAWLGLTWLGDSSLLVFAPVCCLVALFHLLRTNRLRQKLGMNGKVEMPR